MKKSLVGNIFLYQVDLGNSNTDSDSGMVLFIMKVPSCQLPLYSYLQDQLDRGSYEYFEIVEEQNAIHFYFKNIEKGEVKSLVIGVHQKFHGVCY